MSIGKFTLHYFHEVLDFQLIGAANICKIMVKMNYPSSRYLNTRKYPYLFLETHLLKAVFPGNIGQGVHFQ